MAEGEKRGLKEDRFKYLDSAFGENTIERNEEGRKEGKENGKMCVGYPLHAGLCVRCFQ